MTILRNIIVCFLIGVPSLMAFPSLEYQYGFSLSRFNWKTAMGSAFEKPGLSPFFGLKVNYLEFNKFKISSSVGYLENVGVTDVYETNEYGQFLDTIDYAFRYNMVYVNTALEYVLKNRILSPSFFIGPHLDYLLYTTMDSKYDSRVNYGIMVGISVYKQITNHLIINLGERYNTFFNELEKNDIIKIESRYHFTTFVGFSYNVQ